MSYNYITHLKSIFSNFSHADAEIDVAQWRQEGFWKDNPIKPHRLFEALRKTYKPRSKKNKMMISFSSALFKRSGRFSASAKKASHIYDIFFDIDNEEFKKNKENINDSDAWTLEELLLKTKEKLRKELFDTLTKTGLLPYATVVSSGTGLHVHFFLAEIISLSEDISGIPAIEIRQAIVDQLVPILNADPVPSQLQGKGKWLPGTPYTKLSLKIETEVLQDASDFLSLETFYEYVRKIKTNDSAISVNSDYIGLLGEYIGRTKFENSDGSQILIGKDFRMWIKEQISTDETGEAVYKTRPIYTGLAILPKYVVMDSPKNNNDDEDENNTENILYIVEAVNAHEQTLLTLPLTAFEASEKLQKYFIKQNIDFAVERNRRQIFSYVRTHSQRVLGVEIGNHHDMLVHYNFIYKYGRVWKAHKKIVVIEYQNKTEIFYIKGAEAKKENEKDRFYSKEHPVPQKALDGFLAHMDSIMHNKHKNRLFTAWMATALVRDKILENYKEMPNINLYGESGTGKTTFLDAAARIFNVREQTAHPTMHNLYRKQKDMKNMIILLDDFADIDYYRDFLKDSVRSSIRPRRTEDGGIAFPEIRNSLMITTNYAITDDAVANRMIKLFFNKSEIIEDRNAYTSFDSFVDDNQLSILTDLFECVKRINWKEFRGIVNDLISFAMSKTQDVRVAKMYAIVSAIAFVIGISDDAVGLLSTVIEEEKYTTTEKRQLLDVIVNYAVQEASKEFGGVPDHIKKDFVFSHQKFTRYLEDIRYDKNVTQKTVTHEMAPYRNFIKSKRTTVRNVGHGLLYFVDFSLPVFKEYFAETLGSLVRLHKEQMSSA